MDPNATLNNLRQALASYWDLPSGFTPAEEEAIVLDLTEAAQALDEWISRGGFLPTEWER